MQSCRRSSCRAGLLCVNGLIIVVVFKLFSYIRRERHFADPVQYRKQRFPAGAVIIEGNDSVSVLDYLVNRRGQNSVAEGNPCPLAQSPAGADEHLPTVKRFLTEKQKFAGCTALAELFTIYSRRNDLRIVYNKDVARAEILRYIAEYPVLKGLCFPIHNEKPCGVSRLAGVLRYQLLREVKIEIRCFQFRF